MKSAISLSYGTKITSKVQVKCKVIQFIYLLKNLPFQNTNIYITENTALFGINRKEEKRTRKTTISYKKTLKWCAPVYPTQSRVRS